MAAGSSQPPDPGADHTALGWTALGGPALGVLELASIARGARVADVAVKQAPSLLLMSRPVSGGAHLLMMRGEVAEVEESMKLAREVAAGALTDWLELPYLHDSLWPLIERGVAPLTDAPASTGWRDDPEAESVAIVETRTVCAGVHAADAAAKTAPVVVRDLRLAVGIAGKAYFSFTGALADVEAAADAARVIAADRLIELELIARPADEIRGRLFF
ncbi:BMC domain-containing protein [Haliangium sp.]|uniref:BMC domain-containing protein n=1 Tax=Haliangium sp. TaxID=2663208 RepID=UPI003D0BB6E4